MLIALLSIVGGLGMVLHGLNYCSEGLQRSAGQRMKGLLRTLTRSPLQAAAVGALLAAVVQSSTAVTVMLVGLANAGLVTLTQSVGIILGSDVGTTLTVQLLAFDTGPWSLAVVAVGYLITAVAKRRSHQYLGQALVGLGLVFFGLKVIGGAITPLMQNPAVGGALRTAVANPLLAFLAATLLTAVVHSSAATLGLAVSLAAHGVINLTQAVPIILGANVGTCATALLTAAGTSIEAKRVAMAHTIIKIVGVLLLWPLAAPFTRVISFSASAVSRQIANAHTAFNIVIVAVGLPLAARLASLIRVILPDTPANEDPGSPIYLDRRALEAPVLALEQASREIGRMGELIETMLARIPDLLTAQTPAPFEQVARAERSADRIFGEISSYLADIGSRNLGEDSVRAEIQLLHIVSELEHAGDAIFKISLLARKRFDESLTFSTDGVAEMIQLHDRVGELLHESLEAFRLGTAGSEGYTAAAGSDIVSMERQLRETHLGRLSSGLKESRSTSAIHLDILSGLQRISEHALRIRAIARELRELPKARHDVGTLPGLTQG